MIRLEQNNQVFLLFSNISFGVSTNTPRRVRAWPVVTHVVVLGGADGGLNSVQVGLDGLYVHRVLSAAHFQDQLMTKGEASASPTLNFCCYFRHSKREKPKPSPRILSLPLTLALRPMMS